MNNLTRATRPSTKPSIEKVTISNILSFDLESESPIGAS